jgi:DNA topoisomerase-1
VPQKTLVIVESPNKAKKLAAFLGAGYVVKASFGHVADLPAKDYGVDLATLEESYVVRDAKVVKALRSSSPRAASTACCSPPTPTARARPSPGTSRGSSRWAGAASATRCASSSARSPPPPCAPPSPARAPSTRRASTRSARGACSTASSASTARRRSAGPAGAQSAGRCQTPALHLLCEREREILAFVARTYWTLEAAYAEGLVAFVPADPATAATVARDAADDAGGEGERKGRLVPRQFATREEADATREIAGRHPHVVREVQSRRTERRPPPPYTTSTLQQDASRKLRLSAKQAMDAAQALFEAGLITYHRTDSVRVSDDAVAMARAYLAAHHPETLPAQAPRARGSAGAQDAHEAVRPTQLEPGESPPAHAARLYAMIRARFLASQAKPALVDRTTVWADSGPVPWAAEGAVLHDPGFLVFWGPYARQEDVVLPAVQPGQVLTADAVRVHERKTTPPSRYDQGGLIKKLESSGIGRPATFAGIIETLLRRDYVRELEVARGKQVLQPTEFGLQVDGLMSHAFPSW